MKKKLCSALSILMTIMMLFTACSSAQPAAKDPSAAAPAVAPAAPATAPAAPAADEPSEAKTAGLSGELVVATWAGDPYQSAWQDVFTQFEDETGVKVIMDAIPWENLREKTALELASGSGAYDVIYVHPFWFDEFAANNYLIPVEEYATQDELDLYVPGLLDLYRKDGVLYGLPDFICTQTLAYRTDLFEAAGLEPPQSWDDIVSCAQALSDGDNMYGITFPGKKSGALASTFSALLVSNGGWYYGADGKPTINTPEAVEAAAFVAQIAQYAPPGFMNFHWDENGNLAASGKAAIALCMTINSAWLEDPDRSVTAGKWGYLPIRSNKGTPGGIVDSYCWSVTKDNQNMDAAEALVKYVSGTEAQIYFTGTSGTCGATKAYYENTALQQSQPVLRAMNQTFENTEPNPSWSTWSAQQETLETSLQELMNGNTTAADAMAKLQAQMESE